MTNWTSVEVQYSNEIIELHRQWEDLLGGYAVMGVEIGKCSL